MTCRSAVVVGCTALALLVLGSGCGVIGASLLDQYWLEQMSEDVDAVAGDVNALAGDVQSGLEKPGVPGPQGEPGADGVDGKDGANGENGQDGVDGKDGVNGENGQDGVDGKDGVDGNDGTDGVDGNDGTDGVDGADGTDGVDGVDGADGTDGVDGVDGADGADGTDGVDGADGTDGVDGVDGTDGADGYNCWDLNQNGIADLLTEDTNGDGVVDILDCHGADLTGVLARAQIKSDGVNQTAPNAILSSKEATGRYLLSVQIPDSYDAVGLTMFDFPVLVTAQGLPPFPGGPVDIVIGQVEQLSFDAATKVLDLRIHIRQLPTTNYRDAGFSVVVLQP